MKVKTILVSQPPPNVENSPYYELSDKQKVKVDFRSFIHVEGLTSREVRSQKIDFAKFSAIIFTSRKAVDNYFRLAEEMRFKVPDAMKYFCQSEAVAYYLQKYVVYRKRKIYVAERTFEDLIKIIKKYKEETFLLTSAIYFSKAIVIDGFSLEGASISTLKPASAAALTVEFPNTAIRVLFCLKFGKFSNKDLIPDGLKNTKIS